MGEYRDAFFATLQRMEDPNCPPETPSGATGFPIDDLRGMIAQNSSLAGYLNNSVNLLHTILKNGDSSFGVCGSACSSDVSAFLQMQNSLEDNNINIRDAIVQLNRLIFSLASPPVIHNYVKQANYLSIDNFPLDRDDFDGLGNVGNQVSNEIDVKKSYPRKTSGKIAASLKD